MKTYQLLNRIFQPFYYLKLRRNVRAWIGAAVKNPKGVEASFVAEWSYALRNDFGA